MENQKLITLLEIFKLSREKLSYDFINENNEIFEPMFANEDDKVLMNFEIEKYFTSYINYHFKVFQNYSEVDIEFSKAMLFFIKSFKINVSDINVEGGKDLFLKILQDKQLFLQNIIDISNNDDEKYKKLSYSYQKDKRLFEREIQKYKRN